MAGPYDVIVVGARCAGSPVAMLLARKGYRVLLADKSTFPSDMPLSTHWLHQTAVERLRRWGLLPQLEASGCPQIEFISLDFGQFVIKGSARPYKGTTESYAPRRKVIDAILVEGAVKAGAELREGLSVEGLLRDEGGAVTGIRGRTRDGRTVEERASLVVGADGLDSKVATWVEAPAYDEQPVKQGAVWAYWSGVPFRGQELWMEPGRGAFCLPTNDGLTLIAAGVEVERLGGLRAGGEKAYMETVRDVAPQLYERLQGGRRETGFITGAVPGRYRKPYGPGWALVGDAGFLKDPVTASGITDAFRDAELLTEAIDTGLSGARPLAEALAEYEQRRNDASMAHYHFTMELASLQPPPPEIQAVLEACSRSPEATSQFLGVIAQTVPEQEFFDAENIGRIMAAAG